jgi:hypothetical protein
LGPSAARELLVETLIETRAAAHKKDKHAKKGLFIQHSS